MNTRRGKTTKAAQRGATGDGGSSMNTELHKLFLEELADIYNAEQQLLKALPKMAKAAQAEDLAEAFQSHLEETQNHVDRLDDVFASLEKSKERRTCKAMEGLIAEAEENLKEKKGSTALDAVLIAAAQKVEHYEIASYGTVCAWADRMGHDEARDLLQQTLEEEKEADEKLTEIAESIANVEAEEQD